MSNDNRPCPCGSGEPSWWAKDARGIELARVCEKCEKEKLSHYRPDVLSDPNYYYDDGDIEPDTGLEMTLLRMPPF